jgi:hypothetical protein
MTNDAAEERSENEFIGVMQNESVRARPGKAKNA